MGYSAPAAYGGGYGQYVQQQQHVDPQAAAYAQYMQQVACDDRRDVGVITRLAVRIAVCRLSVSGCEYAVRSKLCSRFNCMIFPPFLLRDLCSSTCLTSLFLKCFPRFSYPSRSFSAAAYAQQQPAAAYSAAPYRVPNVVSTLCLTP